MSGELVIVRHADTDWTVSGQHTGRTDLPLNDAGRARALDLRGRLDDRRFVAVWSSPLRRALETAELMGFSPLARDELVEWDYGDYEGLTSAQIDARAPGWDLWRDGCPGGESAADVGERVDRLLADVRGLGGDVALFAHGHVLRVVGARWIGLPPAGGALLALSTASISVLGAEREHAVLWRWNDARAAASIPVSGA